MRVALVALLFAGCLYDYDALRGQGSGTGGTSGEGATGGMDPGSGGTGTGTSGTGGGGPGASGAGGASTGGSSNSGFGGGGAAAGSGGRTVGTGGGSTTAGDPDLVLWYKLDEDSGLVAADSAMFAGGPRNGTLTTIGTGGAVAFSTTHQVGTHALTLTANAAIGGGYVTLPGLTDLAPDALTIAAWVNVTGNLRWQRIFDFGNNATGYMFLTTNEGSDAFGYVRFAITTTGNTMEQRITNASVLTLNAWHHIAVVLGGGSPYVGSLYVDGVLGGTNTAMTLHAVDLGVTANNYLGKSQFPDPYLGGQLDDFRVYRRALGPAEITTLFGLR